MQPKKIEGRIKTKHMTEGLYHYFKMRARAERWNSKKKRKQIKSSQTWSSFELSNANGYCFCEERCISLKRQKKTTKSTKKLMKIKTTTKLTLI